MKWDPAYAIDSPAMDEQHQQMFALVNQIYGALLQNNDRAAAEKPMEELSSLVQIHFRAEEDLMARIGYPRLADHRRQHVELTGRVREFQRDLRAGRTTLTIQLLQFMREWLLNHIQKVDKDYAVHAAEQDKAAQLAAAVPSGEAAV